MLSPRFILLCLVWNVLTATRTLGFVSRSTPAGVARSSRLSCLSRNRLPTGARHVTSPTTAVGMMMSDDFGEDSFGAKAARERINEQLQEMVSSHNILAFIKGNRLMPQCGYSGTLVNILQSLSVPFETVDVLADERIRQGIKDFSNWPTIPQLYLGGEFVGGADIVIELYQSGELQEMIEIAAAS